MIAAALGFAARRIFMVFAREGAAALGWYAGKAVGKHIEARLKEKRIDERAARKAQRSTNRSKTTNRKNER